MNWKGCGKKLSCFNSRYCTGVYLEEMRKPRKILIGLTGSPAET
jgi:hypothetical protein